MRRRCKIPSAPLKKSPTPFAYLCITILAILPAFLPHSPTSSDKVARRSPASLDRSDSSMKGSVSIGGEKNPGAYSVSVQFQIPRHEASYEDVLRGLIETDLSNAISLRFAKEKPFPDSMLRNKLERISEKNGLAYTTTSWLNGFKFLGNRKSRINCSESEEKNRIGERVWKQRCDLDPSWEQSARYLSAFTQAIDCVEHADATECSIKTAGVCKPIDDLPKIAGQNLSANQAAFKFAESALTSNFLLVTVFHLGAQSANVDGAVSFFVGDRKKQKQSIMQTLADRIPKKSDAPMISLNESFD